MSFASGHSALLCIPTDDPPNTTTITIKVSDSAVHVPGTNSEEKSAETTLIVHNLGNVSSQDFKWLTKHHFKNERIFLAPTEKQTEQLRKLIEDLAK
jgi:hypothetical protein